MQEGADIYIVKVYEIQHECDDHSTDDQEEGSLQLILAVIGVIVLIIIALIISGWIYCSQSKRFLQE